MFYKEEDKYDSYQCVVLYGVSRDSTVTETHVVTEADTVVHTSIVHIML